MLSNKQKLKRIYDLLVEEKPDFADAVVWLQGDRYDRAGKTLNLYNNGWAKIIIISGNNVLIGNEVRVGENNISLNKMKDYLLRKGIQEKNIIVDDGSMNTRDQAEHILKIAKSKNWSKLILVGSSFYQPRAFLTFLKQTEKVKWTGRIINQPALVAWNKKPSGRDKTAKIIFSQELEKIEKYKKDLSTISQGIKYLNKQNV